MLQFWVYFFAGMAFVILILDIAQECAAESDHRSQPWHLATAMISLVLAMFLGMFV